MLQSRLFSKTRRDPPKDEVSLNAILLSRAGYIHKELAGVYSILPLGLRVIKKIESIIREEMDAIGGEEMKTSVLQNKENWEKTNRWSDDVVDNWFKTTLKTGGEVGLSFTNEEAYVGIMKQYVSSYRDLPTYPYDFKEIFRNEVRSKSGILRGREFYWKALYSFSRDESEHIAFYNQVKDAYERIFKKVGIGDLTYLTRASGGTFSKFSHEFQAINPAGEDTIYKVPGTKLAINKEIIDEPEALENLDVKRADLIEDKSIEVGNIFTLGTRFSDALDLSYKDESGEKQPVFMGSYGIGLGRLMGTVVEALSDEKGIVWSKSIAPFRAHILSVSEDEKVKALARELYKTLEANGIEALHDDRDVRAGEKFADADLIGIPTRITVGNKTTESRLFEVKDRESGKESEMSLERLIEELKK